MSVFSRCVICTTPTSTHLEEGGDLGQNDEDLSNSSEIVLILKEVLQLPSSSLEGLLETNKRGFFCCPLCVRMAKDLETILGRVKEVVREYYKARALLTKKILVEKGEDFTKCPENSYEQIRREIIRAAKGPLGNLNIEDEDLPICEILHKDPIQIQNWGKKRRGRPKRPRENRSGEEERTGNDIGECSIDNDLQKGEIIAETVAGESSEQWRVRVGEWGGVETRTKVTRKGKSHLTSPGVEDVKTEPLLENSIIIPDNWDNDFSLLQQFSSHLSEESYVGERVGDEEDQEDPDYHSEGLNHDLSEDSESDTDYKPNIMTSKNNRKSGKRTKSSKISILPTTNEKSSLPNPFVSIGPNLSREKLEKLGVKVKDLPLPQKKRGLRGPYKKSLGVSRSKFSGEGFRFKCDYEGCNYGTNFKRKFDEHFRKHTKEMPFKCPKCGKGFRGSWAVVSHLRIHDKPKRTFKCQICPREFTKHKSLQGHITKEHKDPRRQCDICNGIFTSAITLRYHKKRVHEREMDCICDLCGKICVGTRSLQEHIKGHEANPNFKPRAPKTPLQLPENLSLPPIAVISSQAGNTESSAPNPEQLYTSKPGFTCDKEGCGKWFATEKPLQFHIRRYHMTEEERKVSCPICYKVFKGLLDLKKHAAIVHMEARPFPCSICGQAFKVKSHCNRHEKGHSTPGWKPKANCKPKTFPGIINEGPSATISEGIEAINWME